MTEVGTRPSSSVPTWATSLVGIAVPSGVKIIAGWIADEIPPFGTFNWFWNRVGQWLEWTEAVTPRVFDSLGEALRNVTTGTVDIRRKPARRLSVSSSVSVAGASSGNAIASDGEIVVVGTDVATDGFNLRAYRQDDLSTVLWNVTIGGAGYTVTGVAVTGDAIIVVVRSGTTIAKIYSVGRELGLVNESATIVGTHYSAQVATDGLYAYATVVDSSNVHLVRFTIGNFAGGLDWSKTITMLGAPYISYGVSCDGYAVCVVTEPDGSGKNVFVYRATTGTLLSSIAAPAQATSCHLSQGGLVIGHEEGGGGHITFYPLAFNYTPSGAASRTIDIGVGTPEFVKSIRLDQDCYVCCVDMNVAVDSVMLIDRDFSGIQRLSYVSPLGVSGPVNEAYTDGDKIFVIGEETASGNVTIAVNERGLVPGRFLITSFDDVDRYPFFHKAIPIR